MTFEPAGEIPLPPRPQEETLVREYDITEVEFRGGANDVMLAGELTRPHGDGPFPSVVLISGSGPQDRNEELMMHKSFLVLSDYLTRLGYAVLRYDDRGTAGSTGDFRTATTRDFANDAAEALLFLKRMDKINQDRMGYIGHSEGGFVAPLATQIAPADFMVTLAGPSQPFPDVLRRQSVDIAVAEGVPERLVQRQSKLQDDLLAAVTTAASPEAAGGQARTILSQSGLVPTSAIDAQGERLTSPWMLWMLEHDPIPSIAAYDGPVFALYAGKDLQVAPDANEANMRAALQHPESVVKTLPGLNHLFQPAESGAMSEYYQIDITFDEDAMAEIVHWMNDLTAN